MKKILCSALLLLPFSAMFAQKNLQNTSYEVRSVSSGSDLPSFVVFKPVNQPVKDQLDLWFRKNLNANKEFHLEFVNSTKDISGNSHYKYKQLYKGIPVDGAIVNLHYKGSVPHSFNGVYFPGLSIATTALLSESEALSAALSYFPNATFAWQSASFENMLKRSTKNPAATYYPNPEMEIIQDKKEAFRYAFKFDILSVTPMTHKLIYVDAQTGIVLKAKELMMDIEVNGKAQTKYSGIQPIKCDSIGIGTFTLDEISRGAPISTYNYNYGFPEPFYNFTNYWNNINPAQDEIATDIHWGLEKTYDFFKMKFGRNSIDDSAHILFALAHYQDTLGIDYANAAWAGTFMIYGDGNATDYFPLTSVDITGHEVSHGLTQHTAGLIYFEESGALNESFSDIFGKSIEYFASPSLFSWEMGKQIMRPGKTAMRSMEMPNKMGQPKYYKGRYYYTGPRDYGGVHTNSGVQNYWFYLLVNGGAGTRETDFKPFTVKPMGWDTATNIAYMNLTNYLTPTSQFMDAAIASLEQTKLVYGDSSDQAYNVQMAWYAVGLLDKPVEIIKDTPVVVVDTPTSIQLHNTLENSVTVFPNPTQSSITISSAKAFENASIKLLNLTGQVVALKENVKSASVLLDISGQPTGIYILEINEEENVRRIKVVKH